MPWIDTLGLAGETAASVAEAGAVAAAPLEALPIAGAALLGGAALGARSLYRRMTRPRSTPARTPARRVRRRLTYGTPARAPARASIPNMRLGGRMNKELKYNDQFHQTTLNGTVAGAIEDPSTNQNLVGVSIGDGPTNRIGRVVFVHSLYLQGNIVLPTATGSDSSHWYVTLFVVEDKQTNKVLFTPTTFLKEQNVLTAADSFQNLDYSDRYRLLKKKVVRIGSRTRDTDENGSVAVPWKMYIPLGGLKVQHDGVDGTVGSITTSSFHLMAIKSTTAPGALTMNYNVRCRFTD